MTTVVNEDETNPINEKTELLNNNTVLNQEESNLIQTTLNTNESEKQTTLMMSEQEQINLVDTLNQLTQYEFDNSGSENFNDAPLQIDLNESNDNNHPNESFECEKLTTTIILNTNSIQENETNNSYSCNIIDSSTRTPPPSPQTVYRIVEETIQDIVNDISESFVFEDYQMTNKSIIKISQSEFDSSVKIDNKNNENITIVNELNSDQSNDNSITDSTSTSKESFYLNNNTETEMKSTSKILIEKVDNSSCQPQEDLMIINEDQENLSEKEDMVTITSYEPSAKIIIVDESSSSISSIPTTDKQPVSTNQIDDAQYYKNNIKITNVDNTLSRIQSNKLENNLDTNIKTIIKQATLQKTVTFTTIYIFEEYYDPVKKKNVRKHLEKNKTKTVHTDHKFFQVLENYQPNSIQFPTKKSSSKTKINDDDDDNSSLISSSSRSSSIDSFYSAEDSNRSAKKNLKNTESIKSNLPTSYNKDEIIMNLNEIKIEPEIIEEIIIENNENENPELSHSNKNDISTSPVKRSYAKKCTNRRNYLSSRYAEDNDDNNGEYVSGKNISKKGTKKRSRSTINNNNNNYYKKRINSLSANAISNNSVNEKKKELRKRAISTSSTNSKNKIAVTQPFNFSSLKINLTGEKQNEKSAQIEVQQHQQQEETLETFQDNQDSFIINNDLMLSNSNNKEIATKSWIIQHGNPIQHSSVSSNINTNNSNGTPQVFEDFLTNFNVSNLMNDSSVFMNETYPSSFVQNEVVIGYEEENDNNNNNNNNITGLGIDINNNITIKDNNNESDLFNKFKLKPCQVNLKDIKLEYPELSIKKQRIQINLSDDPNLFKTPKSISRSSTGPKFRKTPKNSSLSSSSKSIKKKSPVSQTRPKIRPKFLQNNTCSEKESDITTVRRSTRTRVASSECDLIILSESTNDCPSPKIVSSTGGKKSSTFKRKISQPSRSLPKKSTSFGSIPSRVSLIPAQSTTSHRSIPFQYKFKLNENVFAKHLDGNYYPASVTKITYGKEPKSDVKVEYYTIDFINTNKDNIKKYQQNVTGDFMFQNDQIIPVDILDKHDSVLVFDEKKKDFIHASFLSYSFENNSKMDRAENSYVVSCKKTGMIKSCKLEKMAIHKRNADLMLKRFKESWLEDMKQQDNRIDLDYYANSNNNNNNNYVETTDEESDYDDEYAIAGSKRIKRKKLNDSTDNKKYLNVQRSDDISSSDFEQEQENANISRRSSFSLTTSRAVSTSKSNKYFVSSINTINNKSLFVDTYNLNLDFSEKIIDFRKNDH